jgi:hypothetical protein
MKRNRIHLRKHLEHQCRRLVLVNAVVADVDACGIIGDGIVREEAGEVFPQTFVEVITISALKAFDGGQVFGVGDLRFELCELFGGGCGWRNGCGEE